MLKSYLSGVFLLIFSLLPISCENIESLGLTETEIIGGLKEALQLGARAAGDSLSQTNGYFGNAAMKIWLPKEAQPVLDVASTLGLQSQIDELVLLLNRGAEKAAVKAAPIFVDAITSMTLTDGMNILKGSDSAATAYLRGKTYNQLTSAFAPEINKAMDQVGAAALWNTIFSEYNAYANTFAGQLLNLKPVNPSLGGYATERALTGLFIRVRNEEKFIRDIPAKRTTELLRKVFAEQD
jgi:hypothetical protein